MTGSQSRACRRAEPDRSRHGSAELDQEAVGVAYIGDDLPPGLGLRCALRRSAGGDRAIVERLHVACDQSGLEAERRLAGGGDGHRLAEMLADEVEAGEGEARGAALELAIGLAGLGVEEAPGNTEGAFVEGE